MGEESTQLDLSSELDRLQAMKGDGETGDVRVQIGETVIDPDRVDEHQLVGTTVESDDSSLRGTRWHHPLHDLHRSGVTVERDGQETDLASALDALGGPDLETGYVVDRATGEAAAIVGRVDTQPADGTAEMVDRDAEATDGDTETADGDTESADGDTETADGDAETANGGQSLRLRVVDAPPAAPREVGTERAVTLAALRTASRPGFDDGDRYRTFDPLGRPLDPATV